jgi:HPt (histidine-containing phosphotransfer) domain-containing protein
VFNDAEFLERACDDRELAGIIVGKFVAEVPDDLRTLGVMIESGDAHGVWQLAHRLKGAALNLGASQVGTVALELETIGKSGDLADARQTFTRLEQAYQQLELVLKQTNWL